jgi:predicted kinase
VSKGSTKTIYFLRGLPASGKSTWAKEKLAALNRGGTARAVRTNKDEIRRRLSAKGVNSESRVVARELELVTRALKKGLHVIIDNTHFKPEHEWEYRALSDTYGYNFEIVDFSHVPLNECIVRDGQRRHSVGEAAIRRMDEYGASLTRSVIAERRKEWVAKRAARAARPPRKKDRALSVKHSARID